MHRILLLALKDLRRSLRDRSALAVVIVAPLGLATILSLLLGNRGDARTFTVTFGLVNQDPRGRLAAGFVDGVLDEMHEAGFAEIRKVASLQEATRLANDGKLAAAFVIPRGFSEAVLAGRSAGIEVVTNPEAEVGPSVAVAAAERYAAGVNAVTLSVATAVAGGTGPPDTARVTALVGRALEAPAPVRLADQTAGSKQFAGNTFMAAGMAVFFLFLTAQFGAVGLLVERREGTLARLLASPLTRGGIVAGKALYTYVLGAGSMAVLIVASSLLLGARWGDPVAVAAIVLAGVFAAMGVQSLVATLASTDEQASGYGTLLGVTLGLLGGTFFPLSPGGGFLAEIGKVTPQFWMMRGLAETSGGSSVATVVPSLAALAAFGLVTGSVAIVRARSIVTVA